jgi:hypothetical protein
MDCTATGAAPPTSTPPILIRAVFFLLMGKDIRDRISDPSS